MLIEYLCKKDTFNGYISPSFAQGKKVYQELIKLLDGTGIIKNANSSDLKIESVFGSTLKFFSMESPTSIRGNTISGILVMDEAAFFPTSLPSGEDPYYNVVYPIIKARRPRVLVISTPNGKQGIFYHLYLKAIKKETGYKEITASIYDDELMSPEEIEELKRGYPPLAFAQEFEVQFLDSAITVFPGFESRFGLDTWQPTQRCWIGIDPSTVGTDNTIVSIVNDRDDVKQIKVDGSLDEKYDKIASIINEYNPVHTYCESNSIGEVMANEIRKRLKRRNTFTTFATTNYSKKEYIGLLATLIAQNKISFEKDNTLLYSELGTFTYQLTKTGKITYAARPGCHDDTVTSLGIALQCKEDRRTTSSLAFTPSSLNIIR